ncbi:hypothetical protein [Oceanicoccus sp. KOV_DT_Chl]|uniref:hypothetical protein n=1 Tax=Oceanicoccus sp. KOV_DT_Chl TaxID=1904639 RepID=UPI000C7BB42A|nr:hypothetical protein [Oceanicoccus sp. KOV_DT_Chl]
MSTTVIVGIITIGLFILVTLAITMQTIDKNNKEKRRLEAALNSRSRNFDYMLDGFPEGFLSRDLQVLVCNCLVEVYSQLYQINSKNKDYKDKLDKANMRMAECKQKPANAPSVTLSDPEQIKEVQKMLTSLFNFIAKLAASGRVNSKEAKIYGQQVRRLIVQTSVDALAEPIQNAIKQSKPRLAIHYLHMIIEKMKKENNDGFYTDRINQYTAKIAELEVQATKVDAKEDPNRAAADAEWDELNKPDDTWKKKAVYD